LVIAVSRFRGENAEIKIWFIPGAVELIQVNGAGASSEARPLHRSAVRETQKATNNGGVSIVEMVVANRAPDIVEQNLNPTGLPIFSTRQANVVDVLL